MARYLKRKYVDTKPRYSINLDNKFGEAVVGDYPDKQTAYRDQVQQREVGTFLIQSCDPNEEPWVFHSRVA